MHITVKGKEKHIDIDALQYDIFRRMSAAKKIKLASALSVLCLKLNRLNEYRKSGATAR